MKSLHQIKLASLFIFFNVLVLHSQYCTPAFGNSSQLYISRVVLNTLDHSQTYVSTSNSYSNLTAISTSLIKGNTYSMTIYTARVDSWRNAGYRIWIDYNNDNDFDDANEEIQTLVNNTTSPRNFSFTVPAGVTLGNRRMRINMVAWYEPTSCAIDYGNFGETEDYTVTITGPLNPVATNDNLSVLANSTAGVPNQINVATNDTQGSSDGYDSDNYSITSSPLNTAQGGTVTEISDGVFQYIPATNFIGTDSFNYSFCDTGGDCSTGTVSVSVNLGGCTPTSTSQGSHYITNVNLPGATVTINNASGDNGGYANFTNVAAADLYIGGTYPLTITGNPGLNSGSHRSGWTAYIDFNRNGVFNDAGEMVYDTNGEETTYPFLPRNITVPGTATAGRTIMRVGTRRYYSSNNPCGNTDGQPEEFEDYEVNITTNMTAPQDISIAGNSNNILNGSITPETFNLTNFGVQDLTSGLKNRTFTITNNGYLDLTLGTTPVSFQAGSSATFSIISQPAANTVIPTGTSVSFTIAFDPSTIGTFYATVQISSNDPDENPFGFLIEAEGVQVYRDSDGDGITDNIDIDDDNDGIRDVVEQMGCISNPLASVVETEFLLEDFGSGTSKIKIDGSTAGVTTTYCFEDGTATMGVGECDTNPNLGDGKYTVHYSIANGIAPSIASATGTDLSTWADNAWTTTKDHTEGDINGRMAIFNASFLSGVFYETQVTGVLPGVPITYSFWALNIDNPDANFVPAELPRNLPNVTINFYSTDYSTLLATYDTGDISRCSAAGNTCLQSEWQEFATSTTLPVNEFIIQFVNNAPGGNGNDLALDDIRITQTLCDTDRDGVADIFDLDNENDGIPNIIEAAMVANPDPDENATTMGASWVDTNADGMHDAFFGLTPNDFDGDGVPNYLDLDSDNDTIFDVLEFDGFGDLDISGDGIGDGSDIDSGIANDQLDGDGILGLADTNDSDADANDYGTTGYIGAIDTDGDGMPDYLDVLNNTTSIYDIDTTYFSSLDTNNDGIIDDTTDAENDGIMDSFDTLDSNYGSPRDMTDKFSLYFDGRNDYVEESGDIVLGKSNATLMAWIKLDNTFSNEAVVVGQDNFNIRVTNAKNVAITINGATHTLSDVLLTNKWIHVAAIFDGSNSNVKLYINGELKSTQAAAATISTSANQLFRIGSSPTLVNGNYFKGEIEEVRVFDASLTDTQLQKIVYQELDTTDFSKGTIVPLNVIGLNASNLIRYYRMDSFKDDIVDNLVTPTSDLVTGAKLYNIKNIYFQTAPLPYETIADGNWTNAAIWKHGDVWDISTLPNQAWSIVKIDNEVTTTARNENIGLIISSSGKLTMNGDLELRNTWYLKLDGTIDLQNESQLVQTSESILDVTSAGKIERDQRGQSNLYNYNYWSSPVSPINTTANNTDYTVDGVMKDGINAIPRNISWISGYDGAAGNASTPVSLARYWLYKFENDIDVYANWVQFLETDALRVGQGYTLKASGTATNFTFVGKPNNGTINTNTVTPVNLLLVGNPYPSALDAYQFITDNFNSVDRGIDGTLYFWEHSSTNNTHILVNYLGGYAVLNLSGGVAPVVPSGIAGVGSSSKIPKQFVPVGQGFFVYGKPGGSGPVIFNNGQRAFVKETETNSNTLFKTKIAKVINDSKTPLIKKYQKIRLGFNTNNGYHRQVLLAFMEEKATNKIDYGYDAENMDDFPNDMFLMNGKKHLVIEGVGFFDKNSSYPIGIKADKEGKVSFTIDDLENFDKNQPIYIFDNATNIYHNIRHNKFEVDLKIQPSNSVNTRFSLHFSDKTKDEALNINENMDNENTIIISHIKERSILEIMNRQPDVTIEKVSLFNLLGQSISTWEIENQNQQNISIQIKNTSTGVYIVKIKTSKEILSQKIIIN